MNPESQLAELEKNLVHIEELCQRYHSDLIALEKDCESIKAERATLRQKNELASAKLETLITKLKTMEDAQ